MAINGHFLIIWLTNCSERLLRCTGLQQSYTTALYPQLIMLLVTLALSLLPFAPYFHGHCCLDHKNIFLMLIHVYWCHTLAQPTGTLCLKPICLFESCENRMVHRSLQWSKNPSPACLSHLKKQLCHQTGSYLTWSRHNWLQLCELHLICSQAGNEGASSERSVNFAEFYRQICFNRVLLMKANALFIMS